MYENTRSKVRVDSKYSSEFYVKVGVHQGSALSPSFFAIAMEAISKEYHIDCPWKLLYAHDLVIAAGSLESLKIHSQC